MLAHTSFSYTAQEAAQDENESYDLVEFTGTCTRVEAGVYKVNGYTVKKMVRKSYNHEQWKVVETGDEFVNLKNAKKSLEGKVC